MSTDVIAKLKEMAARPGRVWMVGGATYGDLLDETGRFANAILSLGLVKGDRLLVQVEKCEAVLSLYLACLRTGVVFLPVNPGYTVAETAHFLSDAEPALAVTDPDRVKGLQDLGARVIELPALLALAAGKAGDFADPDHGPDDLAAILYTSGTTGRSKGVMLTRENLASNAEALADLWQFTDRDVLLHALPVFHTHGLFVATNCVLYSGASMIFHRAFQPAAMLAALPKATVMMGVPTFYTRLLSDTGLTRGVTGHVRLFISGSAPLSPATHVEWQDRTGHAILERYGMTETNMNTSNPLKGDRRAGTVGTALPGVEVRVCDEAGAEVARGEIGTVEVRGPNVFRGYWGMPEKTRAELRDTGFFITGDLGVMDDAGYLTIVGRGKDLIISGGFNVYPKEVETAIDALPGVAESAVVGDVTADEVMAGITGVLARFKQPKHVAVVAHLPRNAMGKVQKNVLRERYAGVFEG
jgi:malonyl-CoA/methylmalonyl-CoA synthetase